MSKQLRLDVAQLTDVGRKRPHNEDNMAYVIPKDAQVMAKKGALFIVADGMGGHAAGEVASEIAVDTISKFYYQDDSEDIANALLHAIKRANALIHQRAAENMLRSGMGTTCVAAVLRGATACIANVGDSRAYIVHGNQVKQVSQDHSWVEEQVRAGLLSRDQARSHAQRNVITRCLGTQADVDVDVFSEQLEEGDSLVLCSDGLSGLISDDELRSIVDQYVPQESVYHLVERANENGGPDNITAIVVRVQEVGVEPPNTPRPVYVGGRETDEDTATTLTLPGSSNGLAARLDDGRIPTSPLRLPSGPLGSPESITPAQPILHISQRKRSRLLYPTLALFVLLVVALVAGGGAYLWVHLNAGNIDASLSRAKQLVLQAHDEVTRDPGSALQLLARAQSNLRDVQGHPLNDAQSKKLATVQDDLTGTVKDAITSYNHLSLITSLPCVNTTTSLINNGSTNTHATSIATIQDAKGTFSYALGDDGNLYQLNALDTAQHSLSLVKPLTSLGNAKIVKIAGDGSRLLALTSQGTAPVHYSLNLLVADPSGALTVTNATLINAKPIEDGLRSIQITAWGSDAYVVFTTTSAQDNSTILDYGISADKLSSNPTPSMISISVPLVSVAAFPKNQLFVLLGDGSVQSVQLAGKGTSTPISVVVQNPIAFPLSVSAREFTASMPVPTVPPPPSKFLSVPAATFIVAGSVSNTAHLYILDSKYFRVLDLGLDSAQGAAVPPVTPPATNSTATPASATTGGGVASPSGVKMDLQQQYASPHTFANVKGLVVNAQDPKGPRLSLLTQTAQSSATSGMVSVDLNTKDMACNPDTTS